MEVESYYYYTYFKPRLNKFHSISYRKFEITVFSYFSHFTNLSSFSKKKNSFSSETIKTKIYKFLLTMLYEQFSFCCAEQYEIWRCRLLLQ